MYVMQSTPHLHQIYILRIALNNNALQRKFSTKM